MNTAMRKMVLAWTAMLVFGMRVSAQEVETRSAESILLDHDTSLTVLCRSSAIEKYVWPGYHHEPKEGWKRVGSGYNHECASDNAKAQSVYMGRLERLNSPDIYRHKLSPAVEDIVYNFELLTGIRNSVERDADGVSYISRTARDGWKLWFEKNKERLRYCPVYRVLYAEEKLLRVVDEERKADVER